MHYSLIYEDSVPGLHGVGKQTGKSQDPHNSELPATCSGNLGCFNGIRLFSISRDGTALHRGWYVVACQIE